MELWEVCGGEEEMKEFFGLWETGIGHEESGWNMGKCRKMSTENV